MRLVVLAGLLSTSLVASVASADPNLVVHGEGTAAHLVGADKADQFGWGASGAVDAELALGRMIGFTLGGAVVGLSGAPADGRFAASGSGSAEIGRGGVRVHPFAFGDEGPADHIWLALGGGVADTGSSARPELDARAGLDVKVGRFGFGPTLGLLQIVGGSKVGPRNEDARAVLFGLHLEADVTKKKAPAPVVVEPAPPPKEIDVDGEGTPLAKDGETPAPEHARIVGDQIVLDQRIEFFIDKSIIDSRSLPLVASLARLLNEHPELERVVVEGHADDIGSDEYNMRLSAARARAVRAELVRCGVAGERLDVAYFGKRRPRKVGTTWEARKENRRVELNIVRRREIASDGRSAQNEAKR